MNRDFFYLSHDKSCEYGIEYKILSYIQIP